MGHVKRVFRSANAQNAHGGRRKFRAEHGGLGPDILGCSGNLVAVHEAQVGSARIARKVCTAVVKGGKTHPRHRLALAAAARSKSKAVKAVAAQVLVPRSQPLLLRGGLRGGGKRGAVG